MSVLPSPSRHVTLWPLEILLGPWEALDRRRARAAEQEAQRRIAALPPHLRDDIGLAPAAPRQEQPPRWGGGRG